ncbi:hypothetical protein L1987_87034 [Smallanthus sonchifolius]|nr:hypothetical protein L1987_87034 [Smallanthus sonchifolius]
MHWSGSYWCFKRAYANHSDTKKTLSNWIAMVASHDFDTLCTRFLSSYVLSRTDDVFNVVEKCLFICKLCTIVYFQLGFLESRLLNTADIVHQV